jgi:hypothetical protein
MPLGDLGMKQEHEYKTSELPSEQKASAIAPSRPIWSGSITIGLVNVPVKLYSMIYDKGIAFHFLHKTDGQPVKYVRCVPKKTKLSHGTKWFAATKSPRTNTSLLKRGA